MTQLEKQADIKFCAWLCKAFSQP